MTLERWLVGIVVLLIVAGIGAWWRDHRPQATVTKLSDWRSEANGKPIR